MIMMVVFFLSLLACLICIGGILYSLFKKKPKKLWFRGLAACAAVAIISVGIGAATQTPEERAAYQAKQEQKRADEITKKAAEEATKQVHPTTIAQSTPEPKESSRSWFSWLGNLFGPKTAQEVAKTPQIQSAQSSSPAIPAFTPVYKVLSYKDLDYVNVKRKQVRISVPLGLTRDKLKANLEHAAIETQKKFDSHAVSVFAHREDDKQISSYSAGAADYAPDGDWSKASADAPLSSYKVSVKFNESYFNPVKVLEKGSKVVLKNKSGDIVYISSQAKNWGDKYIIAKVPSGTTATVLDTYKDFAVNNEFIRYKVETKNGTGWVHSWDIDNTVSVDLN